MTNRATTYSSILVFGDISCFILGLLLSLIIRSGGLPRGELLSLHVLPFSLIFILWVTVFYVAGLYELRGVVFKKNIFNLLTTSQLINSGIVILLFYFIPDFLIAPKTILFIDLVVTLGLLFLWRFLFLRYVGNVEREATYVVDSGEVAKRLKKALDHPNYGMEVVSSPALASMIVVDMKTREVRENIKDLYPLIFTNVRFFDLGRVYEEVFGRVPLELLSDLWVLENISLRPKPVYTILKRMMDIAIAFPLFVLSLFCYPFVISAIKIENRGPIFVNQDRVGQRGRTFTMYKFGSMTGNDDGNYPDGSTVLEVTQVGSFLRKSRIDELPQLLSVLMGDQSLVGPRPELPTLAQEYRKQIPYYDVRHAIKPGMSGWAQIYHESHPHHGTAVEQTRDKLSYDLYYVKNRSFLLDLKIALKTVRTLLSRVGV